jgi:hypothetical protein
MTIGAKSKMRANYKLRNMKWTLICNPKLHSKLLSYIICNSGMLIFSWNGICVIHLFSY